MALPRPALLLLALALAMGGEGAAPEADSRVRGGLMPKVDADTWPGWEPDDNFLREYAGWKDQTVPEEIQVYCKGFIPEEATTARIGGYPVMPITGPQGIPIPGLLGMCASTDGRGWSSAPPDAPRPTDARFRAVFGVAGGRGTATVASTNCGYSHNICCQEGGCWGGAKYGEVTCSKHCPDSEMQALRKRCWHLEDVKGGNWSKEGADCQKPGGIAAAKVYIQGRGGNPCGEVMGVKPPVASWDVGIAIFPTKRKVTLTGYVDDAPSYECYAQAKDNGVWGQPVTLAQVPISMKYNIAIELAGYSDKAINPERRVFDLPLLTTSMSNVLV